MRAIREAMDRWTAAEVAAVDWSLPNADLVDALGLQDALSVSDLRTRLRAAGHDVPRAPRERAGERAEEYRRAGLGRVADAEVARRLGVTRQAVAWMRSRSGIRPGRRRPGGRGRAG